jgi:glycosyltransferase involved in cell wall biosynthesis
MASGSQEHPDPGLITVVIPARNAAKVIGEQLEALAHQTYRGSWEVVIADNGSSDGTSRVASAWSERLPALRVIDASDRRGPGAARNEGAREAHGDFLAFCDADDVVAAEWLDALARGARAFDVVTGPLVADLINPRAVTASRPERVPALPTAGRFLPFAPSGNFGVWAAVFRQTCGFDAHYSQSEDVEWSWRAQLAGYEIGFAPDAIVHYRYRVSARSVARQAFGRGMSFARLYRDYRHRGFVRQPWSQGLRTWAWLVVRIPYVFFPARRSTWIRRAGEAAGRLAGGIRFGVLFV